MNIPPSGAAGASSRLLICRVAAAHRSEDPTSSRAPENLVNHPARALDQMQGEQDCSRQPQRERPVTKGWVVPTLIRNDASGGCAVTPGYSPAHYHGAPQRQGTSATTMAATATENTRRYTEIGHVIDAALTACVQGGYQEQRFADAARDLKAGWTEFRARLVDAALAQLPAYLNSSLRVSCEDALEALVRLPLDRMMAEPRFKDYLQRDDALRPLQRPAMHWLSLHIEAVQHVDPQQKSADVAACTLYLQGMDALLRSPMHVAITDTTLRRMFNALSALP